MQSKPLRKRVSAGSCAAAGAPFWADGEAETKREFSAGGVAACEAMAGVCIRMDAFYRHLASCPRSALQEE